MMLTITRPDDWHVHFRDGDFLKDTVPATAMHCKRALVMPNLKPPLTTLTSILEYKMRIMAALPADMTFIPYFSFYLNETVSLAELQQAASVDCILGAKLYPAGATTNSEAGVKSLQALYPHLEIMQTNNMVLQIHGEVTHGDIFEREQYFIEQQLIPLIANFPRLRIVLEHISTKAAVEFITTTDAPIAATITPHHLYYNRNQLLAGGLRPHYYCLPILKHENDQKALREAATSGNPKFFAGTDSAPHSLSSKENACGCAGIYSAPYAVALYAQVFDEMRKLDKLNAFMSHYGANFYQLPINTETLVLEKKAQSIPESLPFGEDKVVPVAAGSSLDWSIRF